ncbi:MAG: diguanylate cyclase [Sulfurifustaceae bacterium]
MFGFGQKKNNEFRSRLARRAADRRMGERRVLVRREEDRVRTASWDEQRTQFVTRYMFGALGLAYFNLGDPVARGADYLVAINVVHVVYLVLTTVYLAHARRHIASPIRLRLAMATDVLGVSAAVFVDANVMSPGWLLYLVIALGNGMRYGARAFAEAALAGFAAAAVVSGLRLSDYSANFSFASLFSILFVGIIVLYSYSLMTNIDRARQGLETASRNDALTGLLNRRGLHERTETLFRSLGGGRALAVLFADLDGFKAVNDAHGHDAGDRLLQDVARAIAGQVRSNDIVSRFGGDEFVVILPDVNYEQAAVIAKRVQDVVTATGRENTQLSVTIGIALAPEHGADLDAVLKRVDAAMYEGKLVGGRGGIRRADGVAVA